MTSATTTETNTSTDATPWPLAPTWPTATEADRRCRDVMVDLETLGTAPDGVMLSIGLVRFDVETGYVGGEWQWHLDVIDQVDAGLRLDPGTAMWWMHPDRRPAVDALLAARQVNRHSRLDEALDGVVAAIRGWGCQVWKSGADQIQYDIPGSGVPVERIWARGPQFDLTILGSAYRARRRQTPWDYWQERDVRTLLEAVQWLTGRRLDREPRPEAAGPRVEHDALSDALEQARHVTLAWQLIREAQLGMEFLAELPLALDAVEPREEVDGPLQERLSEPAGDVMP